MLEKNKVLEGLIGQGMSWEKNKVFEREIICQGINWGKNSIINIFLRLKRIKNGQRYMFNVCCI